jgi:hypothetical protein
MIGYLFSNLYVTVQYFLNPQVAKEPVPQQLEQIAAEILVPLQVTFHHFTDKVYYCTLISYKCIDHN